VREKLPAGSVKAGASFIVRKEIFLAVPVRVTVVAAIALPSTGDVITICGPLSSFLASNMP